jgi:hypothetical protein
VDPAGDYTSLRGKREASREKLDERTAKTGRKAVSATKIKRKKYKNTLDRNWRFANTPIAPVTAFPYENVPTFLSYPHAGNTVSKEHRCRHN